MRLVSGAGIFALYRLTHGPEGPAGLVEAVRAAASHAGVERGCRSARVWCEAGEAGVLLLEEWENRADLERHLRTPAFRRVLAVLELSRTPPEVAYLACDDVRGMDWIAEVRGEVQQP